MQNRIPLEKAAECVCRENSCPPLIFQLPPAQGRAILDAAQNTPVFLYPAQIHRSDADTGQWGTIPVYWICPEGPEPVTGVIFYIHGAGWVFGNLHTHEKLVRELAARTHSIVVFPEYSLSPEARYPTAVEQCYSVLCQLPHLMSRSGLSAPAGSLTVAGDSVGGNMAIAMTRMAKMRGGPAIQRQLLYYPVTNACFSTASYCEFACGYSLYRAGMEWFWNQYTTRPEDRACITASPLRATLEELRDLPDAMILNGQADVLRDEGQAYACLLRRAGNDVTSMVIQATIHDFVMLHALDRTNACRCAMDASVGWINRKVRGC